MECFIPGQNIKVLAKGLQALAKLGDDVNIEITCEKLSFITLNQTQTVCARITFLKTFFTSFELDENCLDSIHKNVTCRIQLKIFLPLFRGNLEKKLDFFKFEYEPKTDFIIVKMKYKFDDLLMIHKLRLMENDAQVVGDTSAPNLNELEVSSEFYNQLLSMFNTNDDEIVFEISDNQIVARNYCPGAPCRPKMMRTQISLNSNDFHKFFIAQQTSINFPLKPFRTAINFAENFNLNIILKFETGGKPLTILLLNTTFEVNFMVATINPYTDTNTTTTSGTSVQNFPRLQTDMEILAKSLAVNNPFDELEMTSNERPESPRTKKLKMVFARCYQPSDNRDMDEHTCWALNSDSE